MEKIVSIDAKIVKCGSLTIGCGYPLNLKKITKNHEYLLNIPNRDDYCIVFCLAAYFFAKNTSDPSNPENPQYINFLTSLNIEGVQFPCQFHDVKKLIENNPGLNIHLNLFCIEQEQVYPIETHIGNGENCVNLLIVNIYDEVQDQVINENGFNESRIRVIEKGNPQLGYGHAILIKNLSGLLKKTYYGPNGKRTGQYAPHWCLACCSAFPTKNSLTKHTSFCVNQKGQIEEFPIKDKTDVLKFKNFDNQYDEELTIFMDFESLTLAKENFIGQGEADAESDSSWSEIVCHHKPITYSMLIVDKCKNIKHEEIWSGEKAHIRFLESTYKIFTITCLLSH